MIKEKEFRRSGLGRAILVVINAIMIIVAVILTTGYSRKIESQQHQLKLDAFCNTIESMKQVSANYFEMELGYVESWAAYIEKSDYSMSEALDYINDSNIDKDVSAHIVDMNTFEAYSSYSANDSNLVDCYKKMKSEDNETNRIFLNSMEEMFDDGNHEVNVLGKYRVYETQMNVISVGTRVELNDNGEHKAYLLLRVIPIEKINSIWVFPTDFASAEVGMITRSGSYVISSRSMRSLSFLDFVRSYNFADDYNRVNELYDELMNNKSGIMEYKNSKGEDCYWYYSSFESNENICILGCARVSDLDVNSETWSMIVIVCASFVIIIGIDGFYILRINRKLRIIASAADAANDAKTRFISSMSHDIRTPMNAIIGMNNLAKRHLDDSAYVSDCLDKANNAGNHLLTLVNDILDISKIESDGIAFNPAPFSINRLFDDIIAMVQAAAEDKELELNIDKKNIMYDYLIGDELRINQVYINILTNAIKYTNIGGKIDITLEQRMTGKKKDSICLLYTVADNGIGMTEEFQRNMYNSFTRATDGRIDKIQGSGLGLAIVKQMVELMDGTIVCNSKLGEGSTFTVKLELPVVSDSKESCDINSDDSPHMDISGMKVLIAEDNELNWEIISELLSEYGISCDRACDGRECVDIMENSQTGTYDAVFMDIQMPVMNGKEAAARIRQSYNQYVRDVPVIAMTADAFATDIRECLDAGMNDHIAKPVDTNKVINLLKKIKRERRN